MLYSFFCSRKPSRPVPEHVTLDKLSQESFRFYRLIQSLLTTTEPDLTHRLTPAVSEVTLPDSNDKLDIASVIGKLQKINHWIWFFIEKLFFFVITRDCS